jgi:hypothetical protein
MKLKAKMKYRGNGIFVEKGNVFEVDGDVGKQMLKDFPEKFSEHGKKKSAPKKSKK